MKGNENMNENVTLDGYFDEAREYIEANAKNEIQTERLNEMIFGLHEEWKHRAKTMDSNKNANETVNFNVQTIHVRNEIVKFAYDTDAIFNFTHRNTQYKPQKISFQALSSEILSPEYLNSGWIEELSPRICQNWKHDKSEILIMYFEPFQFFFIQDGKHRYVEAQKFNKAADNLTHILFHPVAVLMQFLILKANYFIEYSKMFNIIASFVISNNTASLKLAVPLKKAAFCRHAVSNSSCCLLLQISQKSFHTFLRFSPHHKSSDSSHERYPGLRFRG